MPLHNYNIPPKYCLSPYAFNVKRFREMLGIKQEALAHSLGEDWNQKKVSLLEAKEVIEDKLLEEVAKELKVPVEAIRNFDEEAVISVINNTFNSHDNSTMNAVNIQPSFNPMDKIVELYEEVLKVEREKFALLEKNWK